MTNIKIPYPVPKKTKRKHKKWKLEFGNPNSLYGKYIKLNGKEVTL